MIVCHHVSYVDALLLAGAIRRPIRFVMARSIYELPVLNFVFRTSRTIPITSKHADPDTYEAAFAAIGEALESRHLLCIFPEGHLTYDGEIDEFRSGIERIIGRTPVPVVPMALRGLWGSFFSRQGKGAFHRPLSRYWSRVDIVAAEPVTPENVSADDLRERVLALRGKWR